MYEKLYPLEGLREPRTTSEKLHHKDECCKSMCGLSLRTFYGTGIGTGVSGGFYGCDSKVKLFNRAECCQ